MQPQHAEETKQQTSASAKSSAVTLSEDSAAKLHHRLVTRPGRHVGMSMLQVAITTMVFCWGAGGPNLAVQSSAWLPDPSA